MPRKAKAQTGILYAYGFVRGDFDVTRAPSGLDDAAVELAPPKGDVRALVSRLSGAEYAADALERNSGDVAWLSPRAMAHDRVLTWAQEHGGVIPLPMFTLWGGDAALARAIARRNAELKRVFKRVHGADEFGVRVHRRESDMLRTIGDLDPHLAKLRAEAEAASPGQRYLLERKMADQSKQAVRAASQRLSRQVFDALKPLARQSIALPLVPEQGGRATEATLVLNGAFLVDRDRLDEFREAVGAHVRTNQPRGLSFDFTGPWPPYNFVANKKTPPKRSRK
jgi:hypothetical protein